MRDFLVYVVRTEFDSKDYYELFIGWRIVEEDGNVVMGFVRGVWIHDGSTIVTGSGDEVLFHVSCCLDFSRARRVVLQLCAMMVQMGRLIDELCCF